MPSDANPLPKALHPASDGAGSDPTRGFTCAGYWWRPDAPQAKVPGTLRYDPESGVQLALLGTLTGLGGFGGRIPRFSILHGVSADAPGGQALVTLENCVELGSKLTAPGYPTQTFNVARAFFGGLLASDDAPFRRLDFNLSCLRSWLPATGLDYQMAVLNDAPDPRFAASYVRPKDLSANEDGVELAVGFRFIVDPVGSPPHSIGISEEPGISVTVSEPAPLRDLYNTYALPIRDFLTLATDRLIELRELRVRTDAVQQPRADGSLAAAPIRVWFRPRFLGDPDPGSLSPDELLLPYGEVAETFPGLLFRWLRIARELRTVIELFFGSLYNQDEFLHSKFLSLVQALEAYHRIRVEPNRKPMAEKAAFVESVLRQVVEGDRERLAGALRSFASPSTADRLHDMFAACVPTMSPLLGTGAEAFVRRLVTTRNQLTHRFEARPDRVLEGNDLVFATWRLTVLLQSTLLAELGFSAERCATCCQRGWRYVRLLRLAQAEQGDTEGDTGQKKP